MNGRAHPRTGPSGTPGLALALALACGSPAAETGGADIADTGGACPLDGGAVEVGRCAPDFTLPDAAGEPFALSSTRGRVALVDISAVW